MRRIVPLSIAVAACAGLSACGSSATPTTTSSQTPSSPQAALAAMKKAARSQHSVHYVSVRSAPHHSIRIVADVGAKEGINRVTITDHGQTGQATVIVSGGTAYLRGDAFTMRTYLGFTKAQAATYAGKWISVPGKNPGYATVSSDVTFPSYLSHLFEAQTGAAKLSLVKSGRLIGVRGKAYATNGSTVWGTVFAPADGQPLPVKVTSTTTGKSGTGVVTLSNWDEAVPVSAPSNAVPVAKVVGG